MPGGEGAAEREAKERGDGGSGASGDASLKADYTGVMAGEQNGSGGEGSRDPSAGVQASGMSRKTGAPDGPVPKTAAYTAAVATRDVSACDGRSVVGGA